MKQKFEWDGEKIKAVKTMEEEKFSPKEILDSLDNVRNKMHQMETQKLQLENQIKNLESNYKSAVEFEKELKEFEDKCVEIQKEKLKLYISQMHQENVDAAKKSSDATINKDPSAYTEQQKKQLPYLDYQKLIATNNKVSENISRRIITKYLYDEPVFENPFK